MEQPWDVLPEKFLEKLPEIVGKENLNQTLESFTKNKPSTFRANTLKITVEQLDDELKKLDILTEKVSWYKNARILKNVPQKVLTETKWYKEGYLYVQSLSSMIPPLILEPKENEKILDMCAAPGSKTTQIAALMNKTGEIIANDLSRVRSFKLSANLKLQGVTNTKLTNTFGEIIWKKYPEYFDRSLVDVPCSMEGRFNIHDEKSYKDWKVGKVKQLSQKQKFLLRSAVSATKPGGIIVYSTCTLSPEENEEVIDWILDKEKGNIELENVHTILNEKIFTQGLTKFKNKNYNLDLTKTGRITPTSLMEGFYVAKLRKTKSNIINNYL